jgi:hypothetical protein
VPVLPATATPAILAGPPVPASTTATSIRVSVGGDLGADSLREDLLRDSLIDDIEVRAEDSVDEIGLHDDAAVGDGQR